MINLKVDATIESIVDAMNVNFERAESNNVIFAEAIYRLEGEVNELKKELERMKDSMEEMSEYMAVNES